MYMYIYIYIAVVLLDFRLFREKMWRSRWFMYRLYIHATSGFMMDSQFSLLVAGIFLTCNCSFTFR